MHQTLERALADARAGNLGRALASVRLHVRLHPRHPEGLEVQALLLMQAGRPEDAIAALRRAASLAPDAASVRINFASGLQTVGQYRSAIEQYLASLAIDRRNPAAWHGLARSRLHVDDLVGSIEACRMGLEFAPKHPDLTVVLASAFEASGGVREAVDCIEPVLEIHPTHDRLREKYLMLLNYLELPPAEIFQRHQRFGMRGGIAAIGASTVPDPGRPLRIGILSGDLRTHAVANFAKAIFSTKPSDVSLVVFSTFPARPSAAGASIRPEDPVERRFRELATEWVEAHAMDDAALDSAVRGRGVDVLLDLSGHTSHGRLPALERRPAPVIVSAIGYPNTTGSSAVDWRIVDSTTDPPGTESGCLERLIRIDPCFLCFSPGANCPDPVHRDAGDALVLGSFNLASKISDGTVGLWARVLAALPHARLVLKSKWLSSPDAAARLLSRFGQAGVDQRRISILGYAKTTTEHLESYSAIDVALDTFPYNGTTTTCEALWMGVPVVTIRGDRHCARVGASILAAAGLPNWVGEGPEEFTRIVVELAADQAARARFRADARRILSRSPLMDERNYGVRFHRALRSCWTAWCDSQARPPAA